MCWILADGRRPNRWTRRLHWWLLRWRTRNWYRVGAIVEDGDNGSVLGEMLTPYLNCAATHCPPGCTGLGACKHPRTYVAPTLGVNFVEAWRVDDE